MSKEVRKIYKSRGLTPPKCRKGRKHHTVAFHRIVAGIQRAKKEGKTKARSAHAIAMAKLGRKAFK